MPTLCGQCGTFPSCLPCNRWLCVYGCLFLSCGCICLHPKQCDSDCDLLLQLAWVCGRTLHTRTYNWMECVLIDWARQIVIDYCTPSRVPSHSRDSALLLVLVCVSPLAHRPEHVFALTRQITSWSKINQCEPFQWSEKWESASHSLVWQYLCCRVFIPVIIPIQCASRSKTHWYTMLVFCCLFVQCKTCTARWLLIVYWELHCFAPPLCQSSLNWSGTTLLDCMQHKLTTYLIGATLLRILIYLNWLN